MHNAERRTNTTRCHTASQRMGSNTRRLAWERCVGSLCTVRLGPKSAGSNAGHGNDCTLWWIWQHGGDSYSDEKDTAVDTATAARSSCCGRSSCTVSVKQLLGQWAPCVTAKQQGTRTASLQLSCGQQTMRANKQCSRHQQRSSQCSGM